MLLAPETLTAWIKEQESVEARVFNENVVVDERGEEEYLVQQFINSPEEVALLDQGFVYENLLPNRPACISLYYFLVELLPRLVQSQLSFCLPVSPMAASKQFSSSRKKIMFKDIMELCALRARHGHAFGAFLGKLASRSFQAAAAAAAKGEESVFLCFEASLERVDDSEIAARGVDFYAASGLTYGVDVYVQGRWTLETSSMKISLLNKTASSRERVRGTGVHFQQYFVGRLPWPVNVPLPSQLLRTTDSSGLFHDADCLERLSLSLEPAVPAPFVCIKGVCWGLENREIQPEENPMLREWDEDDIAFSISTTCDSGSHSKTVDIMRLTRMGATPLELLKPGPVDARKFASQLQPSSAGHARAAGLLATASSRKRLAAMWDLHQAGSTPSLHSGGTGGGSGEVGSRLQAPPTVASGPEVLQYRKSVYARTSTFRSSRVSFRSQWLEEEAAEDVQVAERPTKKAAKEKFKSYKQDLKEFQQERQTLFTKVDRVASSLPVLTMRLYPGAPFEISVCLVMRALGVCDEEMFYDLVRGGDPDHEFALYKDLLRNSWCLHDGCVTREQALYVIGMTRCRQDSYSALEQVAWQGQWWLMHSFMRRMHPFHWRDTAALSMADLHWSRYVGGLAAGLVLDYVGREYCESLFEEEHRELCQDTQNKKLVFLAQTARRLCRAEAGLPTALTHENGLTDKMVLHNRAVLGVDKLLAFNVAKGLSKVQEKLIKTAKDLGDAACVIDSAAQEFPSEFEPVVNAFATQRDKAKRQDVPLQKVLQLFRGNVHQKMQLSRRVAQVAKSSQGLTSDQKFCLSQLGYLDAAETSKSNKSGYDKRWAFHASCTSQMPLFVRDALRDWIQQQPGVFEPQYLVRALVDRRDVGGCYMVFFWSEVVGVVFRPDTYLRPLVDALSCLRRSPAHPDWYGLRYMTVLRDDKERCLSLFVGSGRHVAPVWTVHPVYQNILLPKQARELFRAAAHANGGRLLPATDFLPLARDREEAAAGHEERISSNIPRAHSYALSNMHADHEQALASRRLWRTLLRFGSITFLSSQESAASWCCETLSRFRQIKRGGLGGQPPRGLTPQGLTPQPQFVDLSPTRMYGLNSLLVIGAECVKGVRMVYGTSLMGHCMSESLSTAPLDGTAYTLAQGHAPLLQNKPTTSLTQTVPYSQNLFAAYRGWGSTQEDGWAFNRDVAKRGSFDYFTRKLIKTSSLFLTPSDALSEHEFEWDLLLQHGADQANPVPRAATRRQQQALSNGKYALNRRIASEYNKFHDSKKKMYRQSLNQVSLLAAAQDFSIPEEGSFFSKGDAVICCNVIDVAAEEEKAFQAAERRRAFASSSRGGKQRAARTLLPAHLRPRAAAGPGWSPLAFSADVTEAYRELGQLLRTHGFVGVFFREPALLEKARSLFSRLDDVGDGDWARKKIAAPMSGTLGRVSACFLVAARSPSSPNPEKFFFSCAGKEEIERTARDLALLKSVVAELTPACCLAATCRLGFEVLHLDQMNVGDKFCNRTGQKSTVCSFVPAYELPRTCDGRVPAVLLGPSQMMRGTPNDVYNTVHNSFVIQNPDLNHVLNTHFGEVQPMSEQIIAGTAFQSAWNSSSRPQPAPAARPETAAARQPQQQPSAADANHNIQIAHTYLLHKNSELGLHTVLEAEIKTKINHAWRQTNTVTEVDHGGPCVTDEDRWSRRVLACVLRQYLYWRCYDCCAKILRLPARRQLEARVLAPATRAWRRLRTVDSLRQLLAGKEESGRPPRKTPLRDHADEDDDLAGVLALQALQLLAVLRPITLSGKKEAGVANPVPAEDFAAEEDPGQELQRLLSSHRRHRRLFSRLFSACRELAFGLETSERSSAENRPPHQRLLEDYLPGVKWFNRLQRARGDRVHHYEQDRDATARDLKTLHDPRPGPSPLQGKTHSPRQEVRRYWRKSSQRLLNPCFDMNLDSVANPTFAGVQTFLKNTKTALCQFKSRHTGPKDPSTHQGVKCSEIYGASRMGHMEIDAITQVGSGRMLDQVIESSDKKQIAVCGRCRGIGKISQATGEMSCFNLDCLRRDRAAEDSDNPRRHMRAVTTTHTLLKLVSTLNATGVSVEIT